VTSKVYVHLLVTVLLTTASVVEGNQSKRVSHVGILGNAPKERTDAFRSKLRELGWIENVTIVIHKTNPPGGIDVWPAIAAEFVRQKVDVIVTVSTEPALAAQNATKTIPIVMAGGADPVEWRLVESLARPGGNVTGVRTLQAELGGKRLELLRDTFPKIARVAIPWNPRSRGQQPQMKEAWAAARLLGVQIEPIGFKSPDDYQSVFAVMKRERVDAFVPLSSPRSAIYRAQIVELALSHKLPAIYPGPEFVEAGGLMSYGPNRVETVSASCCLR
jgi:putative tryptophan/tyrosine transport system substrate-binding protein